ncbi:MAG: hypothetical protein P8X63_07615 [Desulfuromonadaceae bacterium]
MAPLFERNKFHGQEESIVPEILTFVIRRTFLVPLGLLLLLSLALLVTSLVQGQPIAKAIIFTFMILPIIGFFIESVCRRAVIDDEGITVFKCLRQKHLSFAAMTALETVMVRKRVFLTLCVHDEFLILSNAYAEFPKLVRTLLDRVPAGSISPETQAMAKDPPVKTTDIVTCWLAVLLLAFILYIQFHGKG